MEPIINALLEVAVQVATAAAMALMGIAAAWLTARVGRSQSLEAVQTALGEVREAARLTVLELQQTAVEELKAASADGKLTRQEIGELNQALLDKTCRKLSAASAQVLTAAGVDLSALITGTAEACIAQMHQ